MDDLWFFIPTPLVLDISPVQYALADDNAVGDSNQFHVRKHGTGTLITIVQQYFTARISYVLVHAFGRVPHPFAFPVPDRNDGNLERSDRHGKNNAALVMTLFDGCCDNA